MKQITMHVLNQIKDCKNIIDLEITTKKKPNRKIIIENSELIFDLIKNYSKGEQKELLKNITWYNDDCASELMMRGWEVI